MRHYRAVGGNLKDAFDVFTFAFTATFGVNKLDGDAVDPVPMLQVLELVDVMGVASTFTLSFKEG